MERNSVRGVPARAAVGVRNRRDSSQISTPAHRDHRSARLSHPTVDELTTAARLFYCNGAREIGNLIEARFQVTVRAPEAVS